MNAATGEVLWDKTYVGLDMAHGQTTLATASDLVFAGRNDGYFTALDVMTGEELWRFQTGAAIEGGAATYSIDGEQYVVSLSFDGGDIVTAYKLGGQVGEMPHPTPPVVRRGGGGTPTPGSTTNNTVYLGRGNLTADTVNNRGFDRHRRHGAQQPGRRGRDHRDLQESRCGDLPALPEPEGALRDAVLRGSVQR